MTLSRRLMLATAAASIATRTRASLPELRLGVLQFGTVQWVADVIRSHDLDGRHGYALRQITLANTDAGRVSLMAGATDVILSDWPFVAAQRAAGVKLSFAPFSSASGGIMVPANSPIQTLADLRGRKLGVAGGPADKSWLTVRAAAETMLKLDLAAQADCVYGAPPLLAAKLEQGELNAVLTYWNFAAKLGAEGFREAISVADCLRALGVSPHMSMVGFVFHEDYVPIDNFIASVQEAQDLLTDAPSEWNAVRPLMNAPDDALFLQLRDRFQEGMVLAKPDEQAQGAARLLSVLHEIGGPQARNEPEILPPGVFWPVRHAAD